MSVTIVTWAAGTDEQIAAMLDAAKAGDIDLQQDGGWAVGDVRTITVDSFTDGAGTTHAQQSIDIVISSFADYNSCGCLMQFDFKDELATGVRMNSTNTNVGGYGSSEIKTTTIPALVLALPAWMQGRLVEFDVVAGVGNNTNSVETVSGNKLALRSEVEIFGSETYSPAGEGVQVAYYQTSGNRIKKRGHNGSVDRWYERSPKATSSANFCVVLDNGTANSQGAINTAGLAPFGCLTGLAAPTPATDYKVTDTELTAVADAIRSKGGTEAQLEWSSGFVSAIGAISTGTEITSADNGKVVVNAALAAQTARSSNITANGTYDTTTNNSVTVAIPSYDSEEF